MKRLILPFSMILIMSCSKTPLMREVSVKVHPAEVQHTMKAGMGASWHAISKELPLHNEKFTIKVRETGSRGSAYGGNPPTTNIKAWNQIKSHASWLGLNFIRVELSQRMYEPSRNQFDWENAEMQALYEILDWAQENNADVFLQQMWMNVEWNAIPGIHPLISAPHNLDDLTNGIATLLEHLIRKGYSCIKYFCMTNEPPGGTWGYWWEYGPNEGSISEAWKRLRAEFDDRQIGILISGPDWTDMPPFEPEKLDFTKHFGAIDIHSYHGVTQEGEQNLKKWAVWAHTQGKPFFLSEYGNMNLGWGTDDPNQKSFDAAISNACDVIRGLRAGVDGFNRWSFTNRGDLDGQWQLIQTFDRESKEYLSDVTPEPEAYYGFGILSRFLAKYSSTVSIQISEPDSLIMATSLLSPDRQLSIFIVNQSEESLSIHLTISAYPQKTMNLYQVSKTIINTSNFRFDVSQQFDSSQIMEFILPARSISTITSFALANTDQGIIQ